MRGIRTLGWLVSGVLIAGCVGGSSPPPASPSPSITVSTPTSAATPPSPTFDPAAVADVAIVTCTRTAPEIPQPRIRAQPDGVHLRVFHALGRQVSVEFENGAESVAIEEEGQFVVLPIPPQVVGVRCESTGTDPVPMTSLEIVDPLGVYRSAEVTSGGGCTVVSNDYASDARGERGAPLDIARRALVGLRAGDLVEPAEYARADARKVRVVRAGVTIAAVSLFTDGAGGWLISGGQLCEGVGLRT